MGFNTHSTRLYGPHMTLKLFKTYQYLKPFFQHSSSQQYPQFLQDLTMFPQHPQTLPMQDM